jgi:hypothetical protein
MTPDFEGHAGDRGRIRKEIYVVARGSILYMELQI